MARNGYFSCTCNIDHTLVVCVYPDMKGGMHHRVEDISIFDDSNKMYAMYWG